MRFYIGLGGIGCRTLHRFYTECKNRENKAFFYIDTDETSSEFGDAYIVSDIGYGTGMMRAIGRNSVIYEIYSGKMADYFSALINSDEAELVFVVSSFGGFGASALSPLIDYLEALVWNKLKSCVVISFNENCFAESGFPASMIQTFEANTIDFVGELLKQETSVIQTEAFQKSLFNPGSTSYLIDTQCISPDDFWRYIDAPKEALEALDCKKRATYQICRTDTKKLVFISYSFKDQSIADTIADTLLQSGIVPWIATRDLKAGSYAKQIIQAIQRADVFLVLISKNSIKSEQVKNEIDRAFNRLSSGLKIIPFILDDAPLDAECEYYLCRQEMIIGRTPPLAERVKELIDRILEIFE